jgi:hypothetical protein
MSDAYDSELQSIVLKAASDLGLGDRVRPNGTYCFVSGPPYETKIECRFLRSIGGDSVGMSTVPEVIAAKHCGMKILGLSLITNKVVVDNSKDAVHASHAEVLAAVSESGLHVEAIVKRIVTKDIIGAFLSTLPAVNYVKAPVKAIECDKVPAVVSTGVTPAKSECCGKKCCVSGDNITALIGVAALAVGLYLTFASKHCNRK